MNRVIKFRGQQVNTKEWLVGDLNHIQGDVYIFPRDKGCLDSYDNFEVIPETVGMSLCGNDKHGKELFQGDRVIVIDRNHDEGVITWRDEHLAFLVEIKGVKFHLKRKELSDLIKVGNIHEQTPTEQ